jgi:hypothetical protein
MGGAIGQGAFFTAAMPSLVVGNSTFTGNQSLGGSNLLYAVSNYYFPLPADTGSGRGGALGAVAGNVSISQSTLTGNTAQGGSLATDVLNGITLIIMGSTGFGGAVDDEFDFGFTPPPAATALTIVGTSIKSNAALGSGPSGSGNGGGVASAEVNASVSNSICTFTGNQASSGAGITGGIAAAGGLWVGSHGTSEVSNTNFIGNSAIAGSGTDTGGECMAAVSPPRFRSATPRSLRTRPLAAPVRTGATADKLWAAASSTTGEPRPRSWRV